MIIISTIYVKNITKTYTDKELQDVNFDVQASGFTEEEKQKALAALGRVGLLFYVYKRAVNLSGGQQQRELIIRALMS